MSGRALLSKTTSGTVKRSRCTYVCELLVFGVLTFGLGYLARLWQQNLLDGSVTAEPEGLAIEFSPPPQEFDQYVECFMSPEVTVAGKRGHCKLLFEANGLHADHALIDVAKCGELSNAPGQSLYYAPSTIYMRLETDDSAGIGQVLCMQDFAYLKELAPFVPQDRPMRFLDVGANAGFASWLFTRFMRFQGDLVAVEPHPETFVMLRRNMQSSSGIPGFRFFPMNRALVGAQSAINNPSLPLSTKGSGVFMNMHLDTRGTDAESVAVATTSLREISDLSGIDSFDFIKLDIEGAEKELLEDRDPSTLEVLCAARCIVAELHERYVPGCEEAFRQFAESGCPSGVQFRELPTSGEYTLYCREDLFS